MSHKIDAVIPLILKDYERFKILQKSLEIFFKDLGICWVVTRDTEFDEIKLWLEDDKYHVIKESAIIPELKLLRKPRGWYRQQLVKLAIAEKIETDFYLTLDADVICTKPTYYSQLIQNGRAITNVAVGDHFPQWYKWAERVLRLPDLGKRYGVTPALLSRAGVISLQEHLSQEVNPTLKFWAKFLTKESIMYSYLVSWRGYLLRSLPWTEYTLYYTFLEAKGLFEKYHCYGNLYNGYNSVWEKEHFLNWDAKKIFAGAEDGYFCIVQAKRGISPTEIWQKVNVYLDEQ